MPEPTHDELMALWNERAKIKADALREVLPAFKGLTFTPEQLGISGGESVQMDLAEHLTDTFTGRRSLTVTVQQDVFVAIGLRLKEIAEQLQGATWSGPE